MSYKQSFHQCPKHGFFGHSGCTLADADGFFQDCPTCDPDPTKWDLAATAWWYEDELATFVLETRNSAEAVDTLPAVELE